MSVDVVVSKAVSYSVKKTANSFRLCNVTSLYKHINRLKKRQAWSIPQLSWALDFVCYLFAVAKWVLRKLRSKTHLSFRKKKKQKE